MRVEGAGIYLRIPSRALGQNGPHSHVGCVDLHNELALRVGMDQDGGGGESLL